MIIVRERPAGGGSQRFKSGENEARRALPAWDVGLPLMARAGDWYGRKDKSEGALRPARASAGSDAWPLENSPSGRVMELLSANPRPSRAGGGTRGFRWFRVWRRAADFRRRLVLPQTFIDSLAQQVVLRPAQEFDFCDEFGPHPMHAA